MALQGADVIVHPTMRIDYNGNFNESLHWSMRELLTTKYMLLPATLYKCHLPFGKAMGHARIVDPHGRTRADTSHKTGNCFC